jgi:hypothetical protein
MVPVDLVSYFAADRDRDRFFVADVSPAVACGCNLGVWRFV